ncbi:MAG: DEAD/DEAH box helicase [Acidimicrobiales bacterium]
MSEPSFAPDRFQIEATEAVDAGEHVIVAAPTGSGKTYVAEHAARRSLRLERRLFYTTPIKALSNQKFNDLKAEHGADDVGLLTGDNSINPDAPIVVMTTEVLRNMLYAGAELERLGTVVLDEVHYLQDSYRGPVWEEVIIHLPHRVQLVCLSATVSNAEELADWIQTVRGPTRLVLETTRPVELENRYVVAERDGHSLRVISTLLGSKPNRRGFEFDQDAKAAFDQRKRSKRSAGKQKRPTRRWRSPTRSEVLRELRRAEMLPAIHFIFSRAACDDAAREVSSAGLTLTTPQERAEIRSLAHQHVSPLTADERQTLGFDSFLEQLEAGVAAHHAGMVPVFKELVEAAFVRGLVKMVYATETLALGINMPAKSVVIDKLTKWTGDHHEFLTPAQYTQLTGRAGRRGIDELGQALVLWSPWVTFDQVAGLASSRQFVLTSAFRPTYNMTANLVRRYEPERARQLLNLSFAQFRANAGIVRSEHELERLLDRRDEVIRRIEAEFGEVEELRAAVREATTRDEHDAPTDDVSFALSQLKPGQIIEVDGAGLPPHLAVVSVAYRKGNRVKLVGVDVDAETYELDGQSLDEIPIVVGSFEVPQPYLPNSVTFVYEISQDLARSRLMSPKRRRRPDPGSTAAQSRRDLDSIPRPALKALKRLTQLERDIDRRRGSVVADTDSLARQFDAVLSVLRSRGHVDDWTLTSSGRRLASTYHEMDLLVVESLEDGVFDGLSVPELAAMASVFGYEDRSRGSRAPARRGRTTSTSGSNGPIVFPTSELRRRYKAVERLHRYLAREERNTNLPETKPPDPGFMNVAYQWALGIDLDPVLTQSETTPGDFVRTVKQVMDLITQIAVLAPVPLTQRAARQAADALFRDLVTVSQVTSDDADSSETGDAA